MSNRRMALIAALGLMVAWAPSAWSQAWPAKPITFTVPNPPGGLVDTSARIVAEPLARECPKFCVRGGLLNTSLRDVL